MHSAKLVRLISFVLLAMAASLNAAAPNAAAPLRVHGATVMVKSKQHATIFLVRSGNDDGPAEHLFQVWANPGLPLNALYRNADVEFSGPSLLVVVPSENTAITFTVTGNKPTVAPIPEGFSTTSYDVAGLNHENGANVGKYAINAHQPSGRTGANECTNCDFLPFEDPWGSSSGSGSCTSGGLFATSCSQSGTGGSCTVSCSGSGVYACCVAGSPPSCTCRQM